MIVLDLKQAEITHTFARYQVGKVDEDMDDIHEMVTHKIFISVILPNYIFTLWHFKDGRSRVL